jgi:hypothetical protein
MRTLLHIAIVLMLLAGSLARSHAQAPSDSLTNAHQDDPRYIELGATIGPPGGLNVVIGQWFGPWVVRASGMRYNDHTRGQQILAGFEFAQSPGLQHAICLAAGSWSLLDHDCKYIGPAYDLRVSGFFVEFGIGLGYSSYPADQIFWQFGYTFRLPD